MSKKLTKLLLASMAISISFSSIGISEAKNFDIKIATSTAQPITNNEQQLTIEKVRDLYKKAPLTYQELQKSIKDTKRKMPISLATYNIIQQKRERALKETENYLKRMFGKVNPYVMKAFAEVPREYYHYNYQGKYSFIGSAYNIPAIPYGVGYGSALSDFLGQAMMTQLADPKPGETSLEIGTGSGYQASILSRIVKNSYSIEIIQPLGNSVGKIFQPLNFDNVNSKVGDGFYGWKDVKGGFDIIMLTCVASYVPPPLLEQLKPGGRLVIPIGNPFKRNQVLYLYTKDKNGKVKSKRIVGVFFIPMTGKMLQK